MLDSWDHPCDHIHLNVYDLINIVDGGRKHRHGDIDADYHPRISMACVPCHSLDLQCCYIHFWHREMEGENAGLLLLHPSTRPSSTCTWIVTWSPVPAQRRPLDDHPRRQPLRSLGADGWCWSDWNVPRWWVFIVWWQRRPCDVRWWQTLEVWCFDQENLNRSFSS